MPTGSKEHSRRTTNTSEREKEKEWMDGVKREKA